MIFSTQKYIEKELNQAQEGRFCTKDGRECNSFLRVTFRKALIYITLYSRFPSFPAAGGEGGGGLYFWL